MKPDCEKIFESKQKPLTVVEDMTWQHRLPILGKETICDKILSSFYKEIRFQIIKSAASISFILT